MKCGLCLREVEKLSKSHIIPRALMLAGGEKGSHQPLMLMPVDEGKHVGRSHAGIYSEIVCAGCEASFHAGDEALIALSRTYAQGRPFPGEPGEPVMAYSYPNLGNAAVHRGVLTTLYRAHLSDQDLFKHVTLTPEFAEKLRQLVLSNELTHHSDFDIVLRVVPTLHGSVIASPFPEQWDGVSAYRFYFPNVTAVIKVDNQPFSDPFQKLKLGTHEHPVALLADQLAPSEMRMLGRAIHGRHDDVLRIAGPKSDKPEAT
jgi:hypothetical protein